jgi:DNA-binding beta-propeller fold protein YncE
MPMPYASLLRAAAAAALFAALVPPIAAQPNPYGVVADWVEAPGRPLGSASMVAVDAQDNVWLAERCGQNGCDDRPEVAPVLRYDASGRWSGGFGAGLFVWPHGIHVDPNGNVWATDGRAEGARGHQVFKFAPSGELLMTLGEAGVAGSGRNQFSGPTHVAVAANGDIFVADGHEVESNNRIVKFAPDGRFLGTWGRSGSRPGEFLVPHALAFDSRGRLFVADRNNNRIQIFDQEGVFLEEWAQFGRPSGIFIAADDTLYVSDNQSNADNHPGWQRGIRVGSARDGSVWAFIPDPEFDPVNAQETGAHGLAADSQGNIYGAEVWSRTVKKYVRQ